MRIFHVIALALGLTLASYAPFEITRVRHYYSVVKNVQKASEQKVEAYRDDLMQRGMIVDTPVRIGGNLPELDAAADLERGWRLVFGIGIAVSLVSFCGLVCRRADGATNYSLHSTPR